MLTIVEKQNSICNRFIAELRDVKLQKDRMRFNRNLQRIGEVIAYEISKKMDYSIVDVESPFGIAKTNLISSEPVIATVLRAGLPLQQGLLNYFDNADSAFISAYRKHHKDHQFEIKVEYISSPDLNGRVLIICDPMIATGASMVLCYKALLSHGKPSKVFVVGAIGSEQGVDYVRSQMPEASIIIGAVDKELTAKSYIVPGLGDAGDLAFGPKQ